MSSDDDEATQAPFSAVDHANLPEVLKADEAALVLRVSTYQVRQWASAGRIPAVRISNRWRFSKTQLEAFVRGELTMDEASDDGDAPTDP